MPSMSATTQMVPFAWISPCYGQLFKSPNLENGTRLCGFELCKGMSRLGQATLLRFEILALK